MNVKGYRKHFVHIIYVLYVAPAELENILLSHPSIADAAVFGIPDDYSGESLFAHIVHKPNTARVTEGEIKNFIAGKN